jgi:acyl-CoA hydrolase
MKKFVKESLTEMLELVLPNDTNILGNLLGGRLMHWMDIAAALAAARHCNNVCVTKEVDRLTFKRPVTLGEIVRLKSSVNRVFNTSLEVGVRVEVEDIKTGEVFHSNSAYFTFVSVDAKTNKPLSAPEAVPESEEEKRRYAQALERRQQRLNIQKEK